jgi:hypothetical protein
VGDANGNVNSLLCDGVCVFLDAIVCPADCD